MNAAECTDAVLAKLAGDLLPAVRAFAEENTAAVKELVNIPDGGTPSKPIHSKPGEAPRRETGEYRNSWGTVAGIEGDRVTGTSGTPHFLGPILQIKMNRPHASTIADRVRGDAPDRIQAKL